MSAAAAEPWWPVGLAGRILRDWHEHEPSFVPMLVQRIDFAEWFETFEHRMQVSGEDPVDASNLARRLKRAHAAQAMPVSQQLLGWLRDATDRKLLATFETQDPLVPIGGHPRMWPSGMHRLDNVTRGGGYGLTVYGGQPKLGKSLAALGSALTACAHGWTVVYVNAELTPREMRQRIERYLAAPGCTISPVEVGLNLMLVNVNPGFSIEQLLPEIEHTVSLDTTQILIVLDSVNRLAQGDGKMGSGEGAYWHRLRAWSEWPRIATRISEGRLSFLAVSELNRKDQIKGGDLEYGANLVVTFTKAGDSNDLVDIEVTLSRETPAGEVGEHRRDWASSRFISTGEVVRRGASWDE